MAKYFGNGKIREAGILLEELRCLQKFRAKYHVLPPDESQRLCDGMSELARSIPNIGGLKNENELFLLEAKRRMEGEAAYLKHRLEGKAYAFEAVLKILGILKGEVSALKPWLKRNRGKTLEAVERLYKSREIESYELAPRMDIPSVRRQTEEVAAAHIQNYHKILGSFLERLTNVGAYLREVDACPTIQERSSFSPLENRLALSILAFCFSTEEGISKIREKDLIRLYGHEGMGHSLNKVITLSSSLPEFLKIDSDLTISSEESIAQFYEERLLEDLKQNPEIQEKLGIKHKFQEIYQEVKDAEQVEKYLFKLYHYAIVVLADKSFGPLDDNNAIRRRIEFLDELSLNRGYTREFVLKNKDNVDEEGNLGSGLVAELRYCTDPVSRAKKEFNLRGIQYRGKERGIMDETFLTGFWTPSGLVQRARFVAEVYSRKK